MTDYKARTQGSGALFERARKVLPSGITHDARYLDPYSIHVAKAKGPRKWDVDGNEYVDYFGGHGAMLLGHSHPAVIDAVKRQMDLGTHYGSSHELEVRWAELVCELIPSAEKVRFTASGTEASHMAIRLARAYTGKDKIVRFIGHFHGWHDNVAAGATSNYDGSSVPGVAAERHRSHHPDAGRRCRRNGQAARKPRRHRRGDVRAVGRLVGPGAAAAGLRAGDPRRHRQDAAW